MPEFKEFTLFYIEGVVAMTSDTNTYTAICRRCGAAFATSSPRAVCAACTDQAHAALLASKAARRYSEKRTLMQNAYARLGLEAGHVWAKAKGRAA